MYLKNKNVFGGIEANVLIFLFALILLIVSEIPSLLSLVRLILSISGIFTQLIILIMDNSYLRLMKKFLKLPAVIFIIACMFWGNVQYFLSPHKMVALGEIIRLLAGIFSFLIASMVINKEKQSRFLIYALLLIMCIFALFDISRFSINVGNRNHFSAGDVSFIGTHENVGSLIALLLPISVCFSIFKKNGDSQSLIAQMISLIIGFLWVIVRCRSAWIGGMVGLFVLMIIYFRYFHIYGKKYKKQNKMTWFSLLTSPAFLMSLGMIVVIFVAGIIPMLSHRAGSLFNLLEDSSLNIRLMMWKGALRMLSEKPLLGWGLGSFLLLQGRWTNLGDAPEYVITHGTGHQNIAHNYYLQWLAETGAIGLFLYLISMILIIWTGFRALSIEKDFKNKVLISACLAAIFGGVIEANGSPAFHFCGVWSVFWTIIGIMFSRICDIPTELFREKKSISIIVSVVVSLMICVGAIWYGKKLWNPNGQPRGIFQMIELTEGPYYPGDVIRWRAYYRDGWGENQSSNPGTQWIPAIWLEQGSSQSVRLLKSPEWFLTQERFSPSDMIRGFSGMTLRLPAGETGTIQFQARFYDEFGRAYSASRIIEVKRKN